MNSVSLGQLKNHFSPIVARVFIALFANTRSIWDSSCVVARSKFRLLQEALQIVRNRKIFYFKTHQKLNQVIRSSDSRVNVMDFPDN